MKLRTGLVAAALIPLLFAGSTALAHDGGSRGRPGAWWGVLRAVGLTDAQRAQIRQILANHRPQLRSLHEQLRAAEQQLHAQLLGPTPPTAADLAPLNRLREQLASQRLQIALEIRNVLTPEQLARAAQIRQQLEQLREQERTLLAPSS